MIDPPEPLPLSLPAGVRSRRRGLVTMGVAVLETGDDSLPGYVGNWQPIRESNLNPKRAGWTRLPAWVIDW